MNLLKKLYPRRFKQILLSAFVLSFSTALGWTAPATESFQEIEIQGNNRIDRSAVIEKMSLRPGAALTSEAVRRDIQNIFSLGFFKDVQMETSGKKLIVKLVERPYVTRIDYVGSSEFEEKDLVEASKIKAFRVLSYSEIQTAIKAIQKKYEDKG